MRSQIRGGLVASLDETLVDELLAAYEETKRNFHLGGLRLSAVEGGRFCEAAYRMLQEVATGSFVPLGRSLDTDKLTRQLAALPCGSVPDSIRLHIPRALRVVYDIRNNRDAAHLADGIDPNLQDSSLVISILDWVLAELVRIYHGVGPEEAHTLIAGLVTRVVPVIEDFDGFLKVLNPGLRASEHFLVLLYQRDGTGATLDQLTQWARPSMRSNLRRTLRRLEHDRAFIHSEGDRYLITRAGKLHVEQKRLLG